MLHNNGVFIRVFAYLWIHSCVCWGGVKVSTHFHLMLRFSLRLRRHGALHKAVREEKAPSCLWERQPTSSRSWLLKFSFPCVIHGLWKDQVVLIKSSSCGIWKVHCWKTKKAKYCSFPSFHASALVFVPFNVNEELQLERSLSKGTMRLRAHFFNCNDIMR